jgi:hypothetical protein
MKVTLDLTDLVARGQLTPAEAERLKGLAAADTGALASNILLGFGTVAVALGAAALLPSAVTVVVIGALLFGLGLSLRLAGAERWDVYAQICLVVGALGVAGGLIVQFPQIVWVHVGLTVGLAGAAVLARSGLLAALAVLMLVAALGAGTAYFHALYALWVPHPALTIGALSVLTLALYLASLRLPPVYERLAIIAARTAILIINLAFLVGSLFGDDDVHWPDTVFIIGWAVVLLAIGAWAVWENRRWVVNIVAVFFALHFYTQWFERLGASPLSILGGGLLLIVFGVLLRSLNRARGGGIGMPAAPAQ